jgi:hypothetical protein
MIWVVLLTQMTARERGFQLTLKVTNDAGELLPGANVQVSFENENARKPSERVTSVNGVTDPNGQVKLEGKTYDPEIGYGVRKDGHYFLSGKLYRFPDDSAFKWRPWNPTIDVVLKRIKNPVQMYAKRIEGGVPKHDGPLGYDFEIGDWVAPFGKGKVPDIIFVIDSRKRAERDFDWDLAVTFSNQGDGIQRFTPDPEPAYFRSPYEAPEEGYLPEWKLKRWRRPDGPIQTTLEDKGGYFFRVRTELDHDGKVVKALYGKIYGDFFNMVYYLNPDGTRNMEYDPKRNLLKYPNNRVRSYYEVGP